MGNQKTKKYPKEDGIVEIKIDCMNPRCKGSIIVKVHKDDIVPRLGRPRGMRKFCPSCKTHQQGVSEFE